MDRYLYVLLDVFGKCWAIRDGETEKLKGLPSLFKEGWRPVREMTYTASTGPSYMLILLERDGV